MKSSDTNKISFTEIHQALPQIQCGRCDTPGCKEYAESIVEGAPINRCIPGGNETLKKLQTITGNIDQTLDHSYGPSIEPQVALIVEDACIGCAKCIPKCPVDALLEHQANYIKLIQISVLAVNYVLSPALSIVLS